jgi:hypothetical protein
VCEYRQRATGSGSGRIALEGQAVEVVADLDGQDREVAADDRDTICVLHGAHVVAGLVAADRDALPGKS